MNSKTLLLVGMFLTVTAIAGVGAFFWMGNRQPAVEVERSPVVEVISPVITQNPQPTPTASLTTSPTATQTAIPSNWLTYTNLEYGFEISYPPNYQALDDQDNLYGWSNGVVLFYGGGQSYDLPVEAWDNQADYQTKYPASTYNVTVHQVQGKFITLVNANFKPEVDQIIATFQILP